MKKLACLLCVFLLSTHLLSAQVVALKKAHAHNDYQHPNPLADALAHGFTSIEADVYLINNELYVAHDQPTSVEGLASLKTLYLDPLRKHILQTKGFVFAGYTFPVILMIDVKSEAEATYRKLLEQLQEYQDILQTPQNKYGMVRVVISGNRAVNLALQDRTHTVGVDGRLNDLSRSFDTDLMPIISENYTKIISWKGDSDIPAEDFATLKKLADKAHKQGKKLRLWAIPENEKVWQVLLTAGIDFINTDELKRLQQFLLIKDRSTASK